MRAPTRWWQLGPLAALCAFVGMWGFGLGYSWGWGAHAGRLPDFAPWLAERYVNVALLGLTLAAAAAAYLRNTAAINGAWREAPPWLRHIALGMTASFGLMLLFDATAWNALAELWGVAGAGVVLWWVLERSSEGVQDAVWLRRNGGLVRRATRQFRLFASLTAFGLLPLDPTTAAQLGGATTHAEALASIARVRALLRDARVGDIELWPAPDDGENVQRALAGHRDHMDTEVGEHAHVLDRAPALRFAVAEYRRTLALFLSLPVADLPDPDAGKFARSAALDLADRTLDVCQACYDLLRDRGLLP